MTLAEYVTDFPRELFPQMYETLENERDDDATEEGEDERAPVP